MHFTRREVVIGSVAGLGAAAAPLPLRMAIAAVPKSKRPEDYYSDFLALGRIGYGATPETWRMLSDMGLKHYLHKQLSPVDADDAVCNDRLARATLHIEYKASENKPGDKAVGTYPALKEDRPLTALAKPIEELWKLTDNGVKIDGRERQRPLQEVRAATWIRAVYSQWQLREVMVEFWHNHFSVNGTGQAQIAATFPFYDRIMREHCFGNFRALIEDVAKSTAMQYYLNNVKSKASPANENYARELFELHTLGADHYYNNLYNRWREVPGALQGRPIGYIDQDVYEAARAFTGWTIADGGNVRGVTLPKTGEFTYADGWHDNYQKRVLGNEFDPNAAPLADGNKVLDLVAGHPGTAMYLSSKLCRRFIEDNPPQELVARIAKVWQKNLHRPDQIKQVLEAIILSPEFIHNVGSKVKRPFEYAVSFLRATGADVTPNENLFNAVSGAGYRQFEWQTPTGHPDTAEYWLNSNATLSNWNLLAALFSGGFKAAQFDLAAQMPAGFNSGQIVSYWMERLTGAAPDAALFAGLMQYMPRPNDTAFIPDIRDKNFGQNLQQMAMVIGQLPGFQVR